MKRLLFFILFFLLEKHISAICKKNEIQIIGFGSPILDGVVLCESDLTLCERMKREFTYHMSTDFPVEFYKEVLDQAKPLQLGGSAMNTIRATNYLLNIMTSEINPENNCVTSFIGSIAQDHYGEIIKNGLKQENIISFLEESNDEHERTSTNIVLVENLDRILYSDLGSSRKISLNYFKQISDHISKSNIFYADSYLIGTNFAIFKYVYLNISSNSDTLFALNLASENIVREFYDNIMEILPYVDIVFINKQEIKMFKRKFNIEENVMNNSEFMEFFSKNIEKKNKRNNHVIINTRGNQDTLVYFYDYSSGKSDLFSVPVAEVEKSSIVDLNGAGDAFAGGFLAGILLNFSYEKSAYLGNLFAGEVIQLKGFDLPKQINKNKFESFFFKDRLKEKDDL